jgi:hypothetical protein
VCEESVGDGRGTRDLAGVLAERGALLGAAVALEISPSSWSATAGMRSRSSPRVGRKKLAWEESAHARDLVGRRLGMTIAYNAQLPVCSAWDASVVW